MIRPTTIYRSAPILFTSSLLLAIGGVVALYGLSAMCFLSFVLASMPMPPTQGHTTGAWMAAPFSPRPLLIISARLSHILDHDELNAVMAHEMWHYTMRDRLWRFSANLLGFGTAPVTAIRLLRWEVHAIATSLGIIAGLWFIAALSEAWMLRQSEFAADRYAAQLGLALPLRRAIVKIERANREVQGLSPEEQEADIETLHAKYLEDIGGMSAVPIIRGPLFGLSIEGELVVSLIDGKRTVSQLCEDLRKKNPGFTDFIVVRLLHQLIQMDRDRTEALENLLGEAVDRATGLATPHKDSHHIEQ